MFLPSSAVDWLRVACCALCLLVCVVPSAGGAEGRGAERLKGIALGPGKLDIGGSFRTRYEHLDDFSIKGYGNRRDDDVPLLRTRLDLDYRLAESRDAWYRCNGQLQAQGREGRSGPSLGHEIDLIVRYVLSKHIELTCGSGHFWASTFVHGNWGRRDNADWAFAQVMFAF